tara:strand:+ start:962 stop:1330 length:369 start_codon:yes stop_codon:yes gene_type:complete
MNYMDTRAYLIDPVRKSVFQIKYSYLGDYKETAHAINAQYVDAVNLDDKHCVWVDDEGLFQKFVWLWDIKSKFHPKGKRLAGLGLVTGVDEEGETVPPTMSFDELNDSLTFDQHPLIRKDMA